MYCVFQNPETGKYLGQGARFGITADLDRAEVFVIAFVGCNADGVALFEGKTMSGHTLPSDVIPAHYVPRAVSFHLK